MQGFKSLCVGAHQVALHPVAVWRAWTRLYGPVRDPRLALAIIVHDWGYALTRDMDGATGERHVELGARLVTWLCDAPRCRQPVSTPWGTLRLGPWGMFTLLHSRYYARHLGRRPSRLCAADKLAIKLEPAYLARVVLSGEVWEHVRHARAGRYPGVSVDLSDADLRAGTRSPRTRAALRTWQDATRREMARWAHDHAGALTPHPGGPA